MNIRRAVVSDARAVADVHVRTWRSAYRGIVPDAYLDALSVDQRENAWHESITRGSPELWVADSQSVVTGWVAFGPSRDADAAPSVGEVEAIYVSPHQWSMGIGSNLWYTARARLRERKFAAVTLWVLEENQRALGFYRRFGFRPDLSSRKEINIGCKNLWEVRYQCVLLDGTRRPLWEGEK
jgi:ribosomal protein S18 acetylase RimI-like enzyme